MTDVPPSARSGRRLAAWLTFVLLLTALAYGGRFADGGPNVRDYFYRWEFLVLALIQFGVMLAVTLLIARGGPVRELVGMRRPRRWSSAVGPMVAIVIAIFVFSAAYAQLLDVDTEQEQGLVPDEWRPDRAAPFAANFVVATTFVPFVEELVFRGLGFALLARFGRRFAIVAVGMLFGLAHGLVEGFPIIAAFGIALAWLRSRSGSVYPCVLLHGLFNALSLLGAVLLESEGGRG